MDFFCRKVFLFTVLAFYYSTSLPMLLKRMASIQQKKFSLPTAPMQKRLFISPYAMQRISDTLPSELKKFDLTQGLALKESGALSHAYNISLEQSSDLVKLIKKMFHRVTPEGDLLVTKSIFKVATFLTPETMGILMGAIETGELKRGSTEFSQTVIDGWYANPDVQIKLADKDGFEYDTKFKKEVEDFFKLVTRLSQNNKNVLNSVLLAFLYQKINHFEENEEFHDWMHFLASINEYIPVFSAQDLDAAHRKLLSPNDYKSWLNTKLFTLKLNIVPYSSAQYAKFLAENFPLVVSDIIEKNTVESIYPPKVIMDEFGYKGQRKKGDCVETAVRDIILNLFYDAKKKVFRVSKYPHLSIDPRLKEYLEVSTIENINTLAMGQLFMDLVSERPGIGYMEKNYELVSSSDNILQILNTLLGIQAINWTHLGQELTKMSENKIRIDFHLKNMGLKDKVTIAIVDTLDNNKKHIDLSIMRMHAYVAFPEREKFKYNRIDLKSLAEVPTINPLIRSLFYLVRDIHIELLESQAKGTDPLLYFSWPVRNDGEKKEVVQKLLRNYSLDTDAMQYAYSVFKSLNTPEIKLLRDITLFTQYCQDKDLDFKKRTKDAVLADIGLWHLKTLLQKMPIEKIQQLMASFMSSKDFDGALLSNHELLESILFETYGNSVLSYILKKKLLRNDQVGIAREIVLEKIMNNLNDIHFIEKLYTANSLQVSEMLHILTEDERGFYHKKNVCSLLLAQNIDLKNEQLYQQFYRGMFKLYITLLQQDYSKYIKELGDIRLRLKKDSDLYELYDNAMNSIGQKVLVAEE